MAENEKDVILEQLSLSEPLSPTMFFASVAAITNAFCETLKNVTRFARAVINASTPFQRELLGFLSQSGMTMMPSLYPLSAMSQFFANYSWISQPINASVATKGLIKDPTSEKQLHTVAVNTILGGSSHPRLLVATTSHEQ